MTIYLPGDVIQEPTSSESSIIGYGINLRGRTRIATQPGALRNQEGKVWLNVHSKRYIPQEGDRIIAIVTSKTGVFFSIGYRHGRVCVD
uniref:ECR1_N domain-containing protein n=1 Tax=Caenorhabditis tropicalis TaxID=1561998 RepID=A0A1I7T8Q1_9PELO